MSNQPESELEQLNKKLLPIGIEINRLWHASGSRLEIHKWLEKHLPERLADYHEVERVLSAVFSERTRLQAEREQAEKESGM